MRFSLATIIVISFVCSPFSANADICPEGSSSTDQKPYRSAYVHFGGQMIACQMGGNFFAECGPRITLLSENEATVISVEGNSYKFTGNGLVEMPKKSIDCSGGLYCIDSRTQTVKATSEYTALPLLITTNLTWKSTCSKITF